MIEEKMLSKEDVCELLGVSHHTLYRIVNDGSLAVYRIRGQLRFSRSDIESYLEACHVERRTVPDIGRNPRTTVRKLAPDRLPPRYIPGMKVV